MANKSFFRPLLFLSRSLCDVTTTKTQLMAIALFCPLAAELAVQALGARSHANARATLLPG